MARSQETWNKKEREKKKQQKKKEKEERKQERKNESRDGGSSLNDMMAYLDEDGNLTSTPPDPGKKKAEIKLEDIVIGVPKQEDLPPEDLVRSGTVTFFNHTKGFGFIKDEMSRESLFVHVNDLDEPIQEGDKVEFEIGKGHRGPVALKVRHRKNQP